MITTAIPAKPLDTFTLELPKGDTAFLKTIARKMGWAVRSNRRKMSSYENTRKDNPPFMLISLFLKQGTKK